MGTQYGVYLPSVKKDGLSNIVTQLVDKMLTEPDKEHSITLDTSRKVRFLRWQILSILKGLNKKHLWTTSVMGRTLTVIPRIERTEKAILDGEPIS